MSIEALAELSKRLNKFYEFYYSLLEAKHISLGVREYLKDSIPEDLEVVQVDKAEWERWKKVKSIIDNFESP